MYRVELPATGFFEAWRSAARRLASHAIAPEMVQWCRGAGADLFEAAPPPDKEGPHKVSAPASFLQLAETVLCHRDGEAPAALYAALVRHQQDRRALFNPADPLTRKLQAFAKTIRRDIHKMHAFVRFRELPSDSARRRFGAWFEPDHFILEAGTPFFAKRFGDMDWMIATPEGVARFENGALTYHPPTTRPDLPHDASEELWGTYFANIFNPARIHLQAMRSEMPKKYWKNMPETQLIPEMLAHAETRVETMRQAMPAEGPKRAERILDRLRTPEPPAMPETLEVAREAAAACRRCGLCEAATQTVFGEGPEDARLMIVGEQPGDMEDLAGRPFVGPAGTLLREVMGEVGTEPAWMTNAVKHFKFKTQGKKRLHQNPNRQEIEHCRWWLDLERKFVKPQLTIALGASAAFALTGNASAMTPRRGGIEPARDGTPVLITWHPSFILRIPREEQPLRRRELADDLRRAEALLGAQAIKA